MRLSRLTLLLPALALAACAQGALAPATPTVVPAVKTGPTVDGQPVVVVPKGTPVVAVATPVKGKIGTTVASLGDAAQGGMWLKTPLVKGAGQGRVVDAATGKSVAVQLIPLAGPVTGGSQISLKAMQALGVGLTEMPKLTVYGG